MVRVKKRKDMIIITTFHLMFIERKQLVTYGRSDKTAGNLWRVRHLPVFWVAKKVVNPKV